MTISFDIPPHVEGELRREGGGSVADLSAAAKEAFLVESYRQGRLSGRLLGEALGLARAQTEALLKRHRVIEDTLTLDDLEADWRTLERVLGPSRRC